MQRKKHRETHRQINGHTYRHNRRREREPPSESTRDTWGIRKGAVTLSVLRIASYDACWWNSDRIASDDVRLYRRLPLVDRYASHAVFYSDSECLPLERGECGCLHHWERTRTSAMTNLAQAFQYASGAIGDSIVVAGINGRGDGSKPPKCYWSLAW